MKIKWKEMWGSSTTVPASLKWTFPLDIELRLVCWTDEDGSDWKICEAEDGTVYTLCVTP